MTSHRRRANEVDARTLKLHFSPAATRALEAMEATTHFNEEFSEDVRSILQEWAAGKQQTVHDVLIALPLIAEEVFGHIRATGDERAAEAWREFASQMSERGFVLSLPPVIGRR